jgi:V/A-type H+-transporting ATPase subunit E
MNTKLQELTEKIYTEGLEKGKKEAENIISEAEIKANQIIQDARKKAEKIESEAQKNAAFLEKKTKSEISLFTKQAVDSLKSEIANLITGKVVNESVSGSFKDKDFLNRIILAVAKEIAKDKPVVLQVEDKDSLLKFFGSKADEILQNNIKVEQVNGLKTDFSIVSEKDGYKIKAGEEAFINYFKQFLRPQMIKLLFETSTAS